MDPVPAARPDAAPPQPSAISTPGRAAAVFGSVLAERASAVRRTPPPEPADLAPHFPGLEIFALIGQGGMGAVYRVRDRATGQPAALKVVRGDPECSEDFAARFDREAEALTRLDHPSIVAIRGHGQAGPWCWLLMDLVDGANLREVLATGRLSPAQTLALVPPLCAALQYAHDHGVVHRDIKPENILLDANGTPKIADFGLAKLRTDDASRDQLTRTGTVLGTPHYMAPEQVEQAKTVDHRADIYSFGVVLYELLTGRLPMGRFEAPSHQVQIDVRIDEVVLKALERDPERRWQQAGQVGNAVMGIGKDGSQRGSEQISVKAGQKPNHLWKFANHIPTLVLLGAVALTCITDKYVRSLEILCIWLFIWVPASIILRRLHTSESTQNRSYGVTVLALLPFLIGMAQAFTLLYWVTGVDHVLRDIGGLSVPLLYRIATWPSPILPILIAMFLLVLGSFGRRYRWTPVVLGCSSALGVTWLFYVLFIGSGVGAIGGVLGGYDRLVYHEVENTEPPKKKSSEPSPLAPIPIEQTYQRTLAENELRLAKLFLEIGPEQDRPIWARRVNALKARIAELSHQVGRPFAEGAFGGTNFVMVDEHFIFLPTVQQALESTRRRLATSEARAQAGLYPTDDIAEQRVTVAMLEAEAAGKSVSEVMAIRLEAARRRLAALDAQLRVGLVSIEERDAQQNAVELLQAAINGDSAVRIANLRLAGAERAFAAVSGRFRAGVSTTAQYEDAKALVKQLRTELQQAESATRAATPP